MISYITKALTAVLQLGVTMDYSIFLLDSFEENKKQLPGMTGNWQWGMRLPATFKSIIGKLDHNSGRFPCTLQYDVRTWTRHRNRHVEGCYHGSTLLRHVPAVHYSGV